MSWNVAAARLFGHAPDDLVGRHGRVLLPPARRREFARLLAVLRRGEVVERFETQRLTRDGRRIPVSLTLLPWHDAQGRLTGFSTIARSLPRAETARGAARTEPEITDLFEEAPIGLLLASPQGRILRANPALLALLECRPQDCLGRPFSDFHPDQAALARALARLTRRQTLHNFETRLRSRRGRVREAVLDATAFWVNGKVQHTRWFIRDITRRKALEREMLAISERERRALSRDLHDSLGQQLGGIAYLGNVLRDRLAERGIPEAAEMTRICRLLRQALEETRRVSRGLAPVRADPEGLRDALTDLAANSREVFGVTCRVRCATNLPHLGSEAANHLHRIAQEAVNNAIRHGRARRLVITLKRRASELVLTVTDNGRGIGALSPVRKGLGLRIMRHRAALLEGICSVRKRPAGGTEVRCVVPLSGDRVPSPGVHAAKLHAGAGRAAAR